MSSVSSPPSPVPAVDAAGQRTRSNSLGHTTNKEDAGTDSDPTSLTVSDSLVVDSVSSCSIINLSDLSPTSFTHSRASLRSASIAAFIGEKKENSPAQSPSITSSSPAVPSAVSSPPPPPPSPSPLVVSLTEFRERADFKRNYAEYKIDVRSGPLAWSIYKRYSEFQDFHSKMEKFFRPQKSLLARFPRLPPSRLLGNMKIEFLQQRKRELAEYLQAVLRIPELALSVPVLVFLGVLTHEPDQKPKQFQYVSQSLHIDTACEVLKEGDLILMKTEGLLQAVQRSLTFSNYDHVGIVIRVPFESLVPSSLYVLEATIEGVCKYPLRRRLDAWTASKAVVVARQLKMRRTVEFMKTLSAFVSEVEGLPYSLGPLKFLNSAKNNADSTGAGQAASTSYFCSELVAAAYKRLGLLPAAQSAVRYLPASFAEGGGLRLSAPDCALDREILIKFSKPEVFTAVNTANKSARGKGFASSSMPVKASALQEAMAAFDEPTHAHSLADTHSKLTAEDNKKNDNNSNSSSSSSNRAISSSSSVDNPPVSSRRAAALSTGGPQPTTMAGLRVVPFVSGGAQRGSATQPAQEEGAASVLFLDESYGAIRTRANARIG